MKYGWMLYVAFGSAVTTGLHFVAHMSWFLAALIAFLGWPLIGTLITADDDLPGGWSNPDGDVVPGWRTRPFYGQLSLGLAICCACGVIDQGFDDRVGIGFAVAAAICLLLALLLMRSPRSGVRTMRDETKNV